MPDEEAAILRIKEARYRLGREHAVNGYAPSQANEEYQRGYVDGIKELMKGGPWDRA